MTKRVMTEDDYRDLRGDLYLPPSDTSYSENYTSDTDRNSVHPDDDCSGPVNQLSDELGDVY